LKRAPISSVVLELDTLIALAGAYRAARLGDASAAFATAVEQIDVLGRGDTARARARRRDQP